MSSVIAFSKSGKIEVFVCDSCESGISDVHILIGADYVNNFLLEKVVDGEVAWNTTLGWVLSGPTRQNKQVNVGKSKSFRVFCSGRHSAIAGARSDARSTPF